MHVLVGSVAHVRTIEVFPRHDLCVCGMISLRLQVSWARAGLLSGSELIPRRSMALEYREVMVSDMFTWSLKVPRKMGTVVPVFKGSCHMSHFRYFGGSRCLCSTRILVSDDWTRGDVTDS